MDFNDDLVNKSFKDLELKPWIVKQCTEVGIKRPTSIQAHCIPAILDGKDCIGCSKTGSGKTLAFALPILQKLSDDPYGIFALVLTPTRELAFQIADQFHVMGKPMNMRHCVIVGGMNMVAQGNDLAKKPHIVVATPGRLADHLESCNTFTLKKIKFLVLDEADRLLQGHFDEQLQTIFNALPTKRQTLLFSATITDALNKVQEVAVDKPFVWISKAEVATVEKLEQFYVLCPKDVKDGYLVETLRDYKAEKDNKDASVMIFTDTCKGNTYNLVLMREIVNTKFLCRYLTFYRSRNCQVLSMTLDELGFENVALHSMIPQRLRLAALAKFKSATVKILIATDVASRGLDIPTVELVINHNIPSVPKDYIHRVGRTARAGRRGKAISLVTPYDVKNLHAVEEMINTKLVEHKVDDQNVVKILTQVSVTVREAEVKLDNKDFFEKRAVNKRKQLILEGKDPDEVRKVKKKKHKKPKPT